MDIIARHSDSRVFAATPLGTRIFWCTWGDKLAAIRGDPPIRRGIAGYRAMARSTAGIARDPRFHLADGYARRWCPETECHTDVKVLSHLVDDGSGSPKACEHQIVFDAGSWLWYHSACDASAKSPHFHVERRRLRTEVATPGAVIADTPVGPEQRMVLLVASRSLIKPLPNIIKA